MACCLLTITALLETEKSNLIACMSRSPGVSRAAESRRSRTGRVACRPWRSRPRSFETAQPTLRIPQNDIRPFGVIRQGPLDGPSANGQPTLAANPDM